MNCLSTETLSDGVSGSEKMLAIVLIFLKSFLPSPYTAKLRRVSSGQSSLEKRDVSGGSMTVIFSPLSLGEISTGELLGDLKRTWLLISSYSSNLVLGSFSFLEYEAP